MRSFAGPLLSVALTLVIGVAGCGRDEQVMAGGILTGVPYANEHDESIIYEQAKTAVLPGPHRINFLRDKQAIATIAANMVPGVWHEIPRSSIQQVLAARHEAPDNGGVTGPRSVIDAWNGAAFDGRRLYFHGGGHRDYSGNEIYEFDLQALQWRRLTQPSALGTEGRCPMPVDETPLSTHTYDGIVWSGATGTIFRFLGATSYCFGGGNNKQYDLWEFDPQTTQWTQHPDPPHKGFIAKTAQDPATGHIFYGDKATIYEFDPRNKKFRALTSRFPFHGNGVLALDAARRLLLVVDDSGVYKIPMNEAGLITPEVVDLLGEVPPEPLGSWGVAHDTRRGVFVLWDGGRAIVTLDVDSGQMVRYPNPVGAAPSNSGSRGVYSKWVYVNDLDLLVGYNNIKQGVWLYKIPDKPQRVPPHEAGTIRVCPSADFVLGCNFEELSHALSGATRGATIALAPGIYRSGAIVNIDGITIKGEPGAHLKGASVQRKGALVITGDNITIEGIECSQVSVSDGNGACIRGEGNGLTVKGVYFHDNDQGILTGETSGRVVIENSVFERNGQSGRAHGVYIGEVDDLIFRNNKILGTRNAGHGLKSRARRSLIEDNTIAGLHGDDSRALDFPNGGAVTVRRNVLQKGPNSENNDMIGFNLESKPPFFEDSYLLIDQNLFIFDRAVGKLVTPAPNSKIDWGRNTIIGPLDPHHLLSETKDASWFSYKERTDANLPDFPALPSAQWRSQLKKTLVPFDHAP